MEPIQIIMSILGIAWFSTIFWLIHYVRKNHPGIFISENYFDTITSWTDLNTLWKELLFCSSIKKDRMYFFILTQLRIVFILMLIVGLYWTFFSQI